MFHSREKLPRKFVHVTLCAPLTRDLFAIAKFIVTLPQLQQMFVPILTSTLAQFFDKIKIVSFMICIYTAS